MNFVKRTAILAFVSFGLLSAAQSIGNDSDSSNSGATLWADEDSSSRSGAVGASFSGSELDTLTSGFSSSSIENAVSDSISLYTLPSATNRSYLVGLRKTYKSTNVCLGVLIAPKVVISANCPMLVNGKSIASGEVDDSKNSYNMLVASIGNRYPSDDAYGEGNQIAAWVRHQGYRAKTYRYNIYVFYLVAETSMTPIQLADSSSGDPMADGIPAVMMGWPDMDETPFLNVMDATFYSQTRCAKVLKSEHNLGLDDSNVCVMPKKLRNACGLSYGTPLIINQNGQERLAGLLNFNFACDHPKMPIMFSRMAGKQYNWIAFAAQHPWIPSWPKTHSWLWGL